MAHTVNGVQLTPPTAVALKHGISPDCGLSMVQDFPPSTVTVEVGELNCPRGPTLVKKIMATRSFLLRCYYVGCYSYC